MAMEDNESCGSRGAESSAAKSLKQWKKVEVYNEVLRRLKEAEHPEAQDTAFGDQLWTHFNRLPARLPLPTLTHKCSYVPVLTINQPRKLYAIALISDPVLIFCCYRICFHCSCRFLDVVLWVTGFGCLLIISLVLPSKRLFLNYVGWTESD